MIPSASDKAVEVRLMRLYPAQQAMASHPARFKVVMAGRRTGKTSMSIRMACDSLLKGHMVGYFTPTHKLALEVWREFGNRLRPVISRQNEQDRRMELVTGGVLECWTMDSQDPARGRKYHRVIIDEAGITRDLLDIWQAAIRPTLVDFGGDALFLGTPKGRRHGFVTLFQRGMQEEGGEWQSFRLATTDNPYIPPEEIETARKELPADIFAQEFEGVPIDDGACPFNLTKIRQHVGDLSTKPAVVYGIDLARSVDYTVVIGLDAWKRVAVFERWQAPWSDTKQRIVNLVGKTPCVVDATGVGDAIVADLQLMGVAAAAHVFTQSSKLRLMQRLIAAFEAEELTLPAGPIISELETFEFHFTPNGVRYEAAKGCHDDTVMALGLALHGWDRVQVVVPEPEKMGLVFADDPALRSDTVAAMTAGDFTSQLPSEGW